MKQYTNVVLNGVLASAGGDGIQGCVDGVVIYWGAGFLGVELGPGVWDFVVVGPLCVITG